MLTYYNINYISTLLRQRPIRWKYVPTNEGSITYAFFPTLSNCTATFKDLCTPKVPLFLNTPPEPHRSRSMSNVYYCSQITSPHIYLDQMSFAISQPISPITF